MLEPLCRIASRGTLVGEGVTEPYFADIRAVLKRDCSDAPFCVCNEIIAVRLAQTMHLPAADGVLVEYGSDTGFASLLLGPVNMPLPPALNSQTVEIANHYPDEVAALVAFDILIGNIDRVCHEGTGLANLVATLADPDRQVFRGIDHAGALLFFDDDPDNFIKRLDSSELIVRHHQFYGLVQKRSLVQWAERIAKADSLLIRECCMAGQSLPACTEAMLSNLADALVHRAAILPLIITENLPTIKPQP